MMPPLCDLKWSDVGLSDSGQPPSDLAVWPFAQRGALRASELQHGDPSLPEPGERRGPGSVEGPIARPHSPTRRQQLNLQPDSGYWGHDGKSPVPHT